ncbi:hypothetical protein [Klebsiella pneumoniae IS53]|nr:hypothetical protein [Klebsiella pneumoniae IS53]
MGIIPQKATKPAASSTCTILTNNMYMMEIEAINPFFVIFLL